LFYLYTHSLSGQHVMRLTAELIERVPQFTNPLKERELDLRGNKISQIENLGITEDAFDCIDLSDNEISKLENFPLLRRLKTIILHNNRVCRVAVGLGKVLPSLQTLVLHNNHFKDLNELDPLTDLNSLVRLSLLDNPVTKRPGYRFYVIAKCAKLQHLDFRKVKPGERKQAEDMFGTSSGAKDAKTFTPGEGLEGTGLLTEEEQEAIRAQIEAATSYEEITALEKKLLAGT
jgi:U2 small nuclear ribonucleoprotein A'